MSEKIKKFESDLDRLINKGHELHAVIEHEYSGEETNQQLRNKFGKDKMEALIKNLPNFRSEYQSWYSEAFALIKQVLPDRLEGLKTLNHTMNFHVLVRKLQLQTIGSAIICKA